ncbi:MAG: class I SAM-dependent methyltransferase [Pseudomonadota bacterium]
MMFSSFKNLRVLRKPVSCPAFPAGLCLLALCITGCVNVRNDFSPFTGHSGIEFAKESAGLDVGYEPTPMVVVKAILDMGGVGPKDFLIDLGSGDGRIVITAAKAFGARGCGVDLNPKLVALSREYAEEKGVSGRVSFEVRDLFMTDLSRADVVTMYLHPDVNLRLRPKLWRELRPGTRIVSHDFHLGDWRPDRIMTLDVDKPDRDDSLLYLWIMPAVVSGNWQWHLSLPDAERPFQGRFKQHFQNFEGLAGPGKEMRPLFETALRGNRIGFSLVSDFDGRLVRQDYEGFVRGDVIEGTVTLSGGVRKIRLKWRALRAAGE